MVQNVGGIDKIVRVVLGVIILVIGVIQGGLWWILAAAGAVLLVTAAVGFCPLYTPFRINTKSTE